MTKRRVMLVLSDFHLGAGAILPDGRRNYLEDFFYDDKFSEFLDYYCSGEYSKAEIELVIAGDFFNHLQVFPDENKPHLITEKIALRRTEAIINGHSKVFEALKKFSEYPNRKVVFMIGNHDVGLFWPSVRKFLKSKISENIFVNLESYYFKNGVWVEHGNQFTVENPINFKKPFTKIGNDTILNLNWGSLFVVKFLNKVKKERPYIDKVQPFGKYLRWALVHDTFFAFKTMVNIARIFLQHLFGIGEFGPFRFGKTIRFVKKMRIRPPLDRAAKLVMQRNPDCKIVILGHCHTPKVREFYGEREYFNTGLWNELIGMDITNLGKNLRLTFVEVEHFENGPKGILKEWKGEYKVVENIGEQ